MTSRTLTRMLRGGLIALSFWVGGISLGIAQGFVPLSGVQQVSSGLGHACAVLSGGALKCWGGYLGVGDDTRRVRRSPTDPVGLTSGVTSVSAGMSGEFSVMSHTCVLMNTGTAKCWGENNYGQLGIGAEGERLAPADVTGLEAVASIDAGGSHTCAVRTDGAPFCWGSNQRGAVGDGTTISRWTPTPVSGLTNVASIAAGTAHTCAVTSTGGVKCWGNNPNGELGDGTLTRRLAPVDAIASGIAQVAVGGRHSCAMTTGGGVKCWGSNSHGQLGDGSLAPRSIALDVPGLTGVVQVSTGFFHTCALTAAGGVKCWGRNDDGRAGSPAGAPLLSPTDVVGLTSGVVQVSAGDDATCALTSGGGLKCWGANANYQLADGTQQSRSSPVDAGYTTWVEHVLTVTKQGGGSGTVRSFTNEISCGTRCSANIYTDDFVTLEAAPHAGSVFGGWSGACPALTSQRCPNLQMTTAKNVGATFTDYTGILVSRYRLYSPVSQEHHYTTSFTEYAYLTNRIDPNCCFWIGEEAVHRVFSGTGMLGEVTAVPFYRLYNQASRQHHWTTDLHEYNFLPSMGWNQEGIDSYILPSPVAGAVPLYRLYLNVSGGLHLWTTDLVEVNHLTTTAGWQSEGISGYVVPLFP